MSDQKKYPNSALVFVNNDKQDEKHADMKGNGEMTCPHCQKDFALWVNGWRKEGARGKYLRLTFKANDARPAQPTNNPPAKPVSHYQEPTPAPKEDPDVPF